MDWTGNSMAIYSTHGASNHSDGGRQENDYYATDPVAVEKLLEIESFSNTILEPACGGGHISDVLISNGYKVLSTDKYNYGYIKQQDTVDFFEMDVKKYGDKLDIVTNPPYKYAVEFCQKAVEYGQKVAMFLKLTFLEGKKRRGFFKKYPPIRIHVFTSRVNCAKNGDFTKNQSAVCYAWFVWEKGFSGKPTIDWID